MKRREMLNALVAPGSLLALSYCDDGLLDQSGHCYKFIDFQTKVVDFITADIDAADMANIETYDSDNSVERYRNFLDWLFLTFDVDEQHFRDQLIGSLGLERGQKVLIVGCGLGEDLPNVLKKIGEAGELHAQDISRRMILSAARKNAHENVLMTISNASALPYRSGYFDAVFHFGGINLFGDIKGTISEFDRVCKNGGKVVFGDEGIADHLKGTEYYSVAVCNNALWANSPPMDLLPHGAEDISLRYVLGNCFYLIDYTKTKAFPRMNIDIPHKGARGGYGTYSLLRAA